VVRYLAVAHYGRGRGEFRPGEPDPRWAQATAAVVRARAELPHDFVARLRQGSSAAAALEPEVRELLWQVLETLYPDAARQYAASSGA
jgi:hypothetical protein